MPVCNAFSSTDFRAPQAFLALKFREFNNRNKTTYVLDLTCGVPQVSDFGYFAFCHINYPNCVSNKLFQNVNDELKKTSE